MACKGVVNMVLGEDAGTREPVHWVLSRVDTPAAEDCGRYRDIPKKYSQLAGGASDL